VNDVATIANGGVCGRLLCALALSSTFACDAALAQNGSVFSSVSDDTLSLLSPQPLGPAGPLRMHNRDYRGLSLEDWIFYPSFLAGVIFDDNLLYSADRRVSEMGTRLRPALIAKRDAGIHKTILYGNGDFRIYPDFSAGNTINAQAGFSHRWSAQRDLVFKAQGEYDHKTKVTNGGVVLTPIGGAGMLARPQTYNQFQGSAAVQKAFGRLFVGLAGGVVSTIYDPLVTTGGTMSQSYRDNLLTTVSARGGLWVSPSFYVYTEAVGNFRDYANAPNIFLTYNSQGYRTIAGLGSDRISLFRGEIYAGYQRQIYDLSLLGSAGSPVYGGKIYWYPTRAWTVSASLDETFTDSSYPTPSNPRGNPARLTSALLNVDYQLARDWKASLHGGYFHLTYLGSPRVDNSWIAGAVFAYDFSRNLGVALEYNFARVNSNAAYSSYSRNQVGLAATYRY
jgi:hypothetical protein